MFLDNIFHAWIPRDSITPTRYGIRSTLSMLSKRVSTGWVFMNMYGLYYGRRELPYSCRHLSGQACHPGCSLNCICWPETGSSMGAHWGRQNMRSRGSAWGAQGGARVCWGGIPGHFLENAAVWAWQQPDNWHTPSTDCHTGAALLGSGVVHCVHHTWVGASSVIALSQAQAHHLSL